MTASTEWPVDLDEVLDVLEIPLGYKAESLEGRIVLTGLLGGGHEGVVVELSYRFARNGWLVSARSGLITPLGRFIPDLTVADEAFFAAGTGVWWRSPEGGGLVAEVTSSHPSLDRDGKRRGYAAAGIPLYLLVDREAKRTVLFSGPGRGDYRTVSTRLIAEPVELPAPFGFALEDFV